MTGSIDERVARLEDRLRDWKIITVISALAVVVAALVAVAAGLRTPDAVTARAFFLVNENGETLAKLVRHPTAGPVLMFEVGEAGGNVMVGSFGPDAGITVVGKDEAVVTLAIGKNGGPSVSLGDKNRRAWISLGDQGTPSLFLKDGGGHVVVTPSRIELKAASGSDVFRAGVKGVAP
jgi:hypothetical protein